MPMYTILAIHANLSVCVPQWVKPIGVRRKEHKYSVVLIKINALPVQIRTRRDKVLLYAIWNTKFAKGKGGMLRMLCGMDQDGSIVENVCLRTELDRLRAGVEMEIPNDVTGGKQKVIVEADITCWLADLLGTHTLGPWPESFQAQHCCRDCWWSTGCWCSHLPAGHRHLKAVRAHTHGCRGVTDCEMMPRSRQELEEDLHILRTTKFRTKELARQARRDKGIGKLYCTLQGLAQKWDDAAADISHLFLLGLSRHESFWMLDDMTMGRHPVFTWEQLNDQRKGMNPLLPASHKIRSIDRPRTEGKAHHTVNMNMTAAEVMHFAMNSVAMIDPLLDDEDRKRSKWISWKAHVRLLSFCLRHSYMPSDAALLDPLVQDYLHKFSAAYGEKYFKPKHHHLNHLSKYFRCARALCSRSSAWPACAIMISSVRCLCPQALRNPPPSVVHALRGVPRITEVALREFQL